MSANHRRSSFLSQDISLEEVIRTIVSQTGLSREEIKNQIDETIASFNGLLTEVGAALIIGDRLGVKVNAHPPQSGSQDDGSGMDSAVKIKDLIDGMKSINVYGRVAGITPAHEFQKKDGRKGTVASIILKDATGQIRVSCWDQRANLVEASIKQGDIIEVCNAYTRIGRENTVELHVDNRGMLKPKPKGLDESAFPAVPIASNGGSISATGSPTTVMPVKIAEVKEDARFCSFAARVLEKLPPKAFTRKDGTDGSVARVRVADESGSAFVVFWADRMDDYNGLSTGDVYQFENLAVKKNSFGNSTTLEFHANRASKIERPAKTIEIKVDPSAPVIGSGSPAPVAVTRIAEVKEDARFCSFAARVLEKLPPKAFTRKDGTDGSVARVRVADESGSAFVVFWADRMDDYNGLSTGDVYQFENLAV
nr:OB-fold nucleic acid binding domain-containing protein [Candidatus Sigynarchaeum springense]